MKRNLPGLIIIALCISLLSCSGNKKESAASIAQKWCELNGKVYKATSDEEKDKAKTARKNYENEIDDKYKGDEAFKKELEKEVNKCEAASEGR